MGVPPTGCLSNVVVRSQYELQVGCHEPSAGCLPNMYAAFAAYMLCNMVTDLVQRHRTQ